MAHDILTMELNTKKKLKGRMKGQESSASLLKMNIANGREWNYNYYWI